MKTVVMNTAGVVLNVADGEPTREPPEGKVYQVVGDAEVIHIGSVRQEDGTFVLPPPAEDQL